MKKILNKLCKLLSFVVFLTLFSGNGLYAESLYTNSKKGMEAFQKGEFDKALDYYTAAQLEAPEKHEVFYNLGNTHYKTGDYESAMNNYLKVLTSEDKELKQKAHYNLGNTCFRKGDYEEAIKHYENALKFNPDDTSAKKNIEFVRKLMKEQKKKQEQKQDNNKDNKDDKNKKDKNEKKQDKADRNKEDKNGKQKKQEDKKDEQSPPEPKADKQKDNQKSQTGKSEKEGDEAQDKKQAERMLNRLKDNPGKALMPVYENKNVEKDW